jgi:hypothetical protein
MTQVLGLMLRGMACDYDLSPQNAMTVLEKAVRSILLFCVRFTTCLVFFVIAVPLHFMGQTNPSITAFLPLSAKAGAEVTISGFGFSTVASENVVMFGSTRAEVVTPSATSLTVKVPAGAKYGPISVTNLSTGLTSVSRGFFVPTFVGDVSKLGFSDRVDFSADGDVRDLSVGDLDGDGKADLVFGRSGLSLYRNVSTVGSLISSSFSQRVDYYNNKLGLQGDVRSSSIGDLDGDGRPDILATGDNGRVSVLRNVHTGGDFGSSSFAPGVVLPVPGSLEHGFLGDFDGDGRLDVAVVDNAGPYVSILRNKGVPSQLDFDGRLDFPVGSGARNAAVGDLDGDGLPDIVVANNGSRSVSVLRNTSTSSGISFAPGVEIMADDLDLRYIGLADLDGDQRTDMAVVNSGENSVSLDPLLACASFLLRVIVLQPVWVCDAQRLRLEPGAGRAGGLQLLRVEHGRHLADADGELLRPLLGAGDRRAGLPGG